MYPILLKPAFRHMIWGGEKLKTVYGKDIPENSIGESWELACRDDMCSIVANGEYAGMSLLEVFKKHSKEITGTECDSFPWLVKFLDSKRTLSVQVHPDDAYAIPHGDFMGKTEMWYILQADEDSKLIVGFNETLTKQQVKEYAESGKIAEYLNEIPVKQGDCFFIPPGTVHAIKEGLLILEIQQNSDATYRLYDWQRVGDDGKPRQLHIDKAADVVNLKKMKPEPNKTEILDNGDRLLVKCEFFKVCERMVNDKSIIDGMTCVICLEGNIRIDTLEIKAGDTVLVPYTCKNITVNGNGKIIIVSE